MLFLLLALLGLLIYAQVGYPALMAVLVRNKRQFVDENKAEDMTASVLLCVHNGAARIQGRLRNLLEGDWGGLREIIVYCDGCSDETATLASAVDARVKVVIGEQQEGKAMALNKAVLHCNQPVVVLADLRQTFEPTAIRRLVAAFDDQAVGAVSGQLRIATSEGGGGQGIDLYWRLESKLREWEALYDSVVGCTGAIYAIRRESYEPLRPGTLLDDVVVPMQIAVRGWRVSYLPDAIAYDPQSLDPALEKQRKLRTLVGNYQLLEWYPEWLLPWKNRLWWQLISHKYLRLTVPWLLIAIFVLTLMAPKTVLIWLLLAGQTAAYGAAVTGLTMSRARSRLLTIPAGFLLLQWTCLHALLAHLRCRRDPLSLWRRKPGHSGRKSLAE